MSVGTRSRRRSLGAVGTVVLALALMMDMARGQPISFGPFQTLLAILGAVLLGAGLLGTRLPAAWRGLGLLLLNTMVLLWFANLVAGAVLNRLPTPRYAGRVHLPWYDSQPWIENYRADFPQVNDRYRWARWLVWEGAPYRGRVINVDDEGRRRTPGDHCQAGSYVLWTFGGSAMWGVGSPDSLTIAGLLHTELGRLTDRLVCVVNHGERAYMTTQEVIRLERELRRGGRPDAVVFYDGLNDVIYAMQTGDAGAFQDEPGVAQRVFERSPGAAWLRTLPLSRLIKRLRERRLGTDTIPGFRARGVSGDSLARAVADNYHANHRVVAALGAAYGFDAVFFLQPMIAVGQKPLSAEERQSLDALAPGKRDFWRTAYQAIRATSPDAPFGDLSGIFDGEPRALYVDWYHVTPVGNLHAADQIAHVVSSLPSFRKLLRERHGHR
jgi:hypothetical protein